MRQRRQACSPMKCLWVELMFFLEWVLDFQVYSPGQYLQRLVGMEFVRIHRDFALLATHRLVLLEA